MALISGGCAVLAALSGAAWSVVTERLRARHSRLAAAEQRAEERKDARERELRLAYESAASAVVKLSLTVRFVLKVSQEGAARLDGAGLSSQISQVFVDLGEAKSALERLRPWCPRTCHERLEALSNSVTWAADRGVLASAREKPEAVQERLERGLRELSDEIFPAVGTVGLPTEVD